MNLKQEGWEGTGKNDPVICERWKIGNSGLKAKVQQRKQRVYSKLQSEEFSGSGFW
jgi:hypothetical protein